MQPPRLTFLMGPKAMLRMGNPPLRIAVLKTISEVEFDGCWDRRVELQIKELQVPIISLAGPGTGAREEIQRWIVAATAGRWAHPV